MYPASRIFLSWTQGVQPEMIGIRSSSTSSNLADPRDGKMSGGRHWDGCLENLAHLAIVDCGTIEPVFYLFVFIRHGSRYMYPNGSS